MANGKVVIETELDDSGVKSGLNGLSKLSSVATTGLKTLATTIAAVSGALIAAGTYAVNLASDLEEVQNVVDTTFGDNAAQIDKWAKAAGEAFGLSELQAKKFNGTMGAMLKSMGLSEDATYDMSTSMVGLAGDFASFYNLDHQDAFDKIRAGIAGETEPLKQLGVNMSVANLEAYALSQGITESYTAMTQAEQATLRYNYLMYTTADAQGDFAKTSDSFANQLRIAKNEMDNLAASVGKVLLPAVNKGLTGLRGYIDELSTAFDEAGFEGLAEALGEVLAQMITDIAEQAPMFVEASVNILQNLITGLTENSEMIAEAVANVIAQLINAFFILMPQIILLGIDLLINFTKGMIEQMPTMVTTMMDGIKQLVAGILEMLPEFIMTGIDLLVALIFGLAEALPDLIEMIPDIIAAIVVTLTRPDMIAKLVMAALQIILAIGVGLIQAIPQLLLLIPNIVLSIIDGFLDTDWGEVGLNIIKGIMDGMLNMGDLVTKTVKSVGSKITNGIKDFFGIKSPSRKMRDEVGVMLSQGIGVGFEDDIDSTYKDMEATLNAENAKLTTSVQTGGVYNTIANTTPVNVNNTTTSVLEVDGRVLAEVTNEVNDNINLQYGF